MNIGKVMKDTRESRNIPQKAMAQELGITRTALWKIEANRCTPKKETVSMFCHKMQIPPAYLYMQAIEIKDFDLI